MASGEFPSRRRHLRHIWLGVGALIAATLLTEATTPGTVTATADPSLVQRAVPQHWVDYLLGGKNIDVSVVCDYTRDASGKLQPSTSQQPWHGFPTTARPESWALFPNSTRNTFHVSTGMEGEADPGRDNVVENLSVVPQSASSVKVEVSYPLNPDRAPIEQTITIPNGYETVDATDNMMVYGIGNSAGQFTVAIACNKPVTDQIMYDRQTPSFLRQDTQFHYQLAG